MAAQLDPAIGKAATLVRRFSADEEFRLQVEAREKWQRDQATQLAAATDEGLAKGLAQGEAKGQAKERARLLAQAVAQGLSPDMIARIFGATPEEIRQATRD